ncbi:MAG TPA: SMP-30/gluconolactonase/LRE family protein [Candidatus Nitrosotalea sp.]|nr:SMP-30/gluconolactonase/LRE family protein [Candidatus Nitrosotalea sp.]
MKMRWSFPVLIAIGVSLVAFGQTQAPPAPPLPADAPHSLQSNQDPRETAIWKTCKNPPTAPLRPPGPPGPPSNGPAPGVREYTITEIPGVIAAGQEWKFVWQQLGNNGDGIIASPDAGLLIAQNDSSDVVKLDRNGKPSVVYTDTNTGGALSMSSKGALFIVERGVNPSVTRLTPGHNTLADKFDGEPLDCLNAVINDLSADSKGGVYFTMGAVYYAGPTGEVAKYGADLHTNGIVLSTDEKTLYVTDNTRVVAFDVAPDGSLKNEREFGKLEGGGYGDGTTIDEAGRLYVTTGPGVQVLGSDGKYLGLIPTPRPVISAAFSGHNKGTLYILARGARDQEGHEVANAAQVYSIQMIAQGFKKRAK